MYNSVPSDSSRLQNVKETIKQTVTHEKIFEMMATEADISKALKQIKLNKSDDDGKLFSNHILYAPVSLYKYVACLFNGMTVHGYTPICLLNSNIISIPKDSRGDLCTDDNDWGISMCSSFMKLYEVILIQKQGEDCSHLICSLL